MTPVKHFPAERIRAANYPSRIARAVAEAIKESTMSRADIAKAMSASLGENVTPGMLDQYTSTANERNNIPAHRLIALVAVTGDVRVINAALQDTSFIAIDKSFEPLIRRELARERLAEVQREIDEAEAQWRAGK
ncbi:hypothetical protein HU230_0008035 [Bradyrhizobium quebecense]|uniref:Uncharacterized protein n=1 Tax=Bradyrhizobium quebecense TaxID=2748629 RepID=A0A973WPM8_9BRAD|nr:hypothetical protein [Bradyrhizobium quebecense]UGA45976.1 hypothetical protein HU230_0008035 [Bradyrhizobium quebecense]